MSCDASSVSSDSDWIITSKVNTDDALFIKDSVDTLIHNFNIESYTHNKSTTGERAKQYDLFNYLYDPRYGLPLLNKIKVEIKQILSHENKAVNDLHLKTAWTVLGYENSFHRVHNHYKKIVPEHIAVVVYLSVSDIDPCRTGAFYAILQDSKKENYKFAHYPEVGDILIFPNWVYHGTEPQADGLRQTLNLDFELVE